MLTRLRERSACGFCLRTLARPDVDVLNELTPAISVDQERIDANLRSTVGAGKHLAVYVGT